MAYVWIAVVILPDFSVFSVSQRLQDRGARGKMVLSIVETVPASGKPPAADDSIIRTSTGERYGFGALTPSMTRASPMHLLGAERVPRR